SNLLRHHTVRRGWAGTARPPAPQQLDLFTDYEVWYKQQQAEKAALTKERRIQQETLLNIKGKYGKNSILRGLNLAEGATAILRNQQIGRHKA
ncbi:MAG: DNA methylase, partial [Bacteroides sp.]